MLRKGLENPPEILNSGPGVVPDNVLTRQYDAISQGRSTVSLPPPMPIARNQIEPDTDTIVPQDELPAELHRPVFTPRLPGTLDGFQGIDLATNEVLGDNGEAFALNDAEIQLVRKLCFEVAERATLARMAGLRERLGL